MKIFSAILAVALTVFLAAALAQGPQKENLKVIYNLSGNLQTLENKELVITFSDDMAPLGGKRDGGAIVQITPAIKGEFFWRGNRSLAFKPEARFRFSTTYTATIPAGTRSLAGKTLPQALRWQWNTPLVLPVAIKTAAQDYFSDLTPGEKLNFQVWVKDAITLRFNQPVTAVSAKDFIVLKETKSGEPELIRAFQKAADEVEIQYTRDLKRGADYQFIVKKGFCGSEVSTGTDKDFTFTFATIPSFQYTGVRPLITFPDAAYCRLSF
ncbi:MAG: Ig-like domain-containing protein, partial [Chrysiogenales bacterium]